MPPPQTPIYLDWQFWAAISAILALVLSQLPPVRLWFLPRRLEVEVHHKIQVTHKIGNPNLGLFASIRNTGGRILRIKALELSVARDGEALGRFPAQNYFERLSEQSMVLFVPFTLKPGDSWEHGTNFFNEFDRATEKSYREHASALTTDIGAKLEAKADSDKTPVVAESAMVEPFQKLFERLFAWIPGEYIVELKVLAEPDSASFSQKYRFTLFESDTTELRSYADDFKFGGSIMYSAQRHTGIYVSLQPHSG